MTSSAIEAARRRGEWLMVDQGSASRPTGDGRPAYNPATGNEEIPADALFSSHYKIQTRGNLTSREVEVGGRTAIETKVELHLPVDTAPLQVGDLWTCDTPAADSLEVAGRVWRVTSIAVGTHRTARRYEVEMS